MSDAFRTFTTDVLDAAGRQLVWSNYVLDVCYYDSSDEEWLGDFSAVPDNPFVNPDFSDTTITGTGPFDAPGYGWYETSTDATNPPETKGTYLYRLPFDYHNDLLAEYGTLLSNSTTFAGDTDRVVGNYFVDTNTYNTPPRHGSFPARFSNYTQTSFLAWATASGVPGGYEGWITWKLNPPQEVAGFSIESFDRAYVAFPECLDRAIGDYQIQLAASGTGLDDGDYTTVVSATNPYGQINPLWHEITPTTAEYVRIKLRNSGSTEGTSLKRVFVYPPETVSAGMSLVARRTAFADDPTFKINQQVDFSGVDRLYFDIEDYGHQSTDNLASVYVNGAEQASFGFNSTAEVAYALRRGLSIDTSSFGNNSTFRVSKRLYSTSQQNIMLMSNFTVVAPWYSEIASAKRGDDAAFPENALVVVDVAGMSILDVGRGLEDVGVAPKLWMRFDLGPKKMLPYLPRKVVVRNGRIYAATSRGLFVIDFPANCAYLFDEWGVRVRYGIDLRNENSFDRDIPEGLMRTLHGFCHDYSSPTIPVRDVYDIAVGTDDVFGDFVVLGTSFGLVVHNDAVGAGGFFYRSADRRPVYNVSVQGGAVWYTRNAHHTQGVDRSGTVCFIEDINSVTGDDFEPDEVHDQHLVLQDSLSGPINTSSWNVVREDPNMAMEEGSVLTISGTHRQGGATGIIHKDTIPNRSFTARLKVKLLEFPSDARGGLRFGLAHDYLDHGLYSSRSYMGASQRTGFFLSALNADPYEGHLVQDAPFDTASLSDQPRWVFTIPANRNQQPSFHIRPTTEGLDVRAELTLFVNDTLTLIRTVSAWPMLRRDFTARLWVKIYGGFTPHATETIPYENAGAWFGLCKNQLMLPGSPHDDSDFVDPAMMAAGSATFSGTHVYCVGKIYETGDYPVFDPTLVQGEAIPFFGDENTGAAAFREWRIDYDAAQDELTAFIDGTPISTQAGGNVEQPPVAGFSFGVQTRRGYYGPYDWRKCRFKDFTVTYPGLASGSRYKYALEVGDSYGGITNVLSHHATYSGISATTDSTPASSTLSGYPNISDGTLHGAGKSMSSTTSVGIGLDSPQTIEALYLYDSVDTTDGWHDTDTSKSAEVWLSSDNVSWALYREYDLRHLERSSGVTKINFCPALESKFIKVRSTDAAANYKVGGGTSWAVSEVRALAVSGTGFFTGDATASAPFREWRLEYNADTRQIDGYVDDVLVSTGSLPEGAEESHFVIAHDLSPVNSGTETGFRAEFKDFQVTFSGIEYVVPGEVTGFSVNSSPVVGGGVDYSVYTATSSGVGVANLERGSGASLPDLYREFDHADDVFGYSDTPRTVFADATAGRAGGLVFVATGSYAPSRYVFRSRRPYWFEWWADAGYSDWAFRYGGTYSMVYHPGQNKLCFLFSKDGGFLNLLDMDSKNWEPITRYFFRSAFGLDSDDPWQGSTAQMVYSPHDDRVWSIFETSSLASMDLVSGATQAVSTSQTMNTSDDRVFIAYILHDHSLLFGDDYISLYSVPDSAQIPHPRNWSEGYPHYAKYLWGRQEYIPWWVSSLQGAASAVYCDFDKHVYMLGSDGSVAGETVFCRYDPSKDYVDVLHSGNVDGVSWPVSDETLASLPPVNAWRDKSTQLVYDPHRRRVYIISGRGTIAQFHYYDVVTQQWAYEGDTPPYVSQRNWPGAIEQNKQDSVRATYNVRDKSILMTSRGVDSVLYEYLPPSDTADLGFYYRPSVDGLPTSSGVSKHFTVVSSPISSGYTNEDELERDFYRSANANAAGAGWLSLGFDSSTVTLSGSSFGDRPAYDHWITTEKVDVVGDYEVSMDVALPFFSKHPSGSDHNYGHAYFVMGISDGINRQGTDDDDFGYADPYLYQVAEVRAGVSGTLGDGVTEFPFMGHVVYSDGQNSEWVPSHNVTSVLEAYSSYGTGLDLGSGFSDFKRFRLCYEYETDTIEGFIDDVSVGSTTLRRKFSVGGTRFHFGFNVMTDQSSDGWLAQIKNLEVCAPTEDVVVDRRLVSSVSGTMNSHYHERWDITLMSGTSWVYDTDIYVPTSRRFTGYDYITTLAGIGDGHRLVELVAYVGAGQRKKVGLVGTRDTLHDRDTYLASAFHVWDDIDIGSYHIVRDTATDTVRVYLNGEESPSISVPYSSLPRYNYQHVYYGKKKYGNFECIYNNPTTSGTWTDTPEFSGFSDPAVGKRAFDSSAKFAVIAQDTRAYAVYDIDPDLGEVPLYAFYHSEGYDTAMNTPFTVHSSGLISSPTIVGEGEVISSFETGIDEDGDADEGAVTIRVDQRRKADGTGTSVDKDKAEGSGWVYLGTFRDPTRVVITNDAAVGTPSEVGFVCANAIGVDIGRYGKSTCTFSVGHVRYQTGQTTLTPEPYEPAGVTVIDLGTNQRIDAYGEHTAPALTDSNMTSGDAFE